MADLLDAFQDLIDPNTVARASQLLGESDSAVSKGLAAGGAALLAALAQRADDSATIRQAHSLAIEAANHTGSLRDVAGLLGAGSGSPVGALGSRLLSTLFGGGTDGIARALASYTGMSFSAASQLVSLAAPLALGLLGERAKREGLGAAGLASLLLSQRDALLRAVPAALASVLGSTPRAAAAPPRESARPPARARAGSRWLWPVLALLVLGGLWALLRGGPDRVETPATAPLPPVATAPDTALVALRLPNGVELEVAPAGIEVRLVEFLSDASRPIDDTAWFDFDRLLFETGSATLRSESNAQLRNIAEILKAFPEVEVKIGGYTDNVGDPSGNLRLSEARAGNVMDELAAQGVAADRLEAEGYGEQHPVADNASEQGRAQNRRISLRVTER